MSSILKWILAVGAAVLVFQNRYKIMNMLLGQYFIRKWLVRYSMEIPFLRNMFVQSTFKM